MIIEEPDWEEFLVLNKRRSIENCRKWFKENVKPANERERILPKGVGLEDMNHLMTVEDA